MSGFETTNESLLRLPEVKARVGAGRSTIYRMVAAGTFPAPFKLGSTTAWKASEIAAWIDGLPRAARQVGGAKG
jgi:prophage regulatory protein